MSSEIVVVNEQDFSAFLKEKLGDHYDRALKVFQDYGKSVSWDITNVLLHAVDKQKISEVLDTLEKHFKEIALDRQHPDARGTYKGKTTGLMFMKICNDILELEPIEA